MKIYRLCELQEAITGRQHCKIAICCSERNLQFFMDEHPELYAEVKARDIEIVLAKTTRIIRR